MATKKKPARPVTRAVGMKRLLKLAGVLEKLPPERFYYGSWVGLSWAGKPDLSCGTTACALGWGAVKMPELDLTIRVDTKFGGGFVWLKNRRRRLDYGPSAHSFLAGAMAFGITEDEAAFLFSPQSSGLWASSPPKDVARHIRAFVARGGMPESSDA